MKSEEKDIHVLLIDDDEDEFVITRNLFTELGKSYRLSWIGDYKRGLVEVMKPEYDVCLLDFHLGGRTGLDFLKEAVSRNCPLPIIFLTGQGDYQVDLAAMKAGASDFLDKGELTARTLDRSLRYSMERKKNEERIRFLAYYDQLTHLPNRTLFYDRLKTAFASAKRHNRFCAVMFLDIDNFKRVNDSLGHTLGDLLIREVADRLAFCIRREDTVSHDNFNVMLDTVARLGGDEFTILLSEIKEGANASVVAERIRGALLAPVLLEEHEIIMTVSIGIALYPHDGADIETVVKNADVAMYNAKARGKNNFQYFSPAMNAAALERLNLEQELRRALEADEFTLCYQPVVDLNTERIVGAEALLAWRHPSKGVIPPLEFLPIAEETGLIYEFGKRVFALLGDDCAEWRRRGLPETPLSINLSPKQLSQRNLLFMVRQFLDATVRQPESLTLEITEEAVIPHPEETRKIIEDVRRTGVRIALDDFGSGYSSFLLLREIQFDALKIGHSLIAGLPDNPGDATITGSLLSIGRSLEIRVIAAGIERPAQQAALKKMGCQWGQGFLFHQPLSRDQLAALLEPDRA